MRALSIRQPWAHAILHLGKRVENRDWAGCSYRGPVLLHASKTLVLREFDEAVGTVLAVVHPEPEPHPDLPGLVSGSVWDRRVETARAFAVSKLSLGGAHAGWRPAPTLPFGGIVGRAQIIGEVRGERDLWEHGAAWWTGGFAIVLADVEPLPFIPWKGSLGFFEVPDELVQEAEAKVVGHFAESDPLCDPQRSCHAFLG